MQRERTIVIQIEGRANDTDAPTVEDFFEQIRDYVDLICAVEKAVAEDQKSHLVWRVTNATKSSPLRVFLTAFPDVYGTDISTRYSRTIKYTKDGLNALSKGEKAPVNFPIDALQYADKTFARISNGLAQTTLEFGNNSQTIIFDSETASKARKNTKKLLGSHDKEQSYIEVGSSEGTVQNIGRDGYGRGILTLRDRLTGTPIKCVLKEDAQSQIGEHSILEVLSGSRIRVYGEKKFKSLGVLQEIEAEKVEFVRPDTQLPNYEDIKDKDFTGGMRSEEYLERLRNGEFE
jgi:hypothetical protein